MSKFNLNEGLGYKDLSGLMKNTVYIDEFSSKMGDDDEIVVAIGIMINPISLK